MGLGFRVQGLLIPNRLGNPGPLLGFFRWTVMFWGYVATVS